LDFVAIWPGWDRYVYHGKAVQLIYSTFGFLCALLWTTAGAPNRGDGSMAPPAQ
jgi:hypothetical protein